MTLSREPSSRSGRILIVEDEPDVGDVLRHVLSRERFEVFLARNGAEALDLCRREQPDLVMLDLSLPDMDGLEILKLLRSGPATSRVRIIIVTARETEVDRIIGLELGADDYVAKPFSTRELVLRVRAVLDRSAPRSGSDEALIGTGPVEVDMERHEASLDGRPLDLTLTEFRLLAELVRAGGRVRTREALLETVWGYTSDVMSRTVDTHIRRLRNKLGESAEWLNTVRGVGYRFEEPKSGS